jgi:ABC-type multidrug transport system fused ATPase/permease subunit
MFSETIQGVSSIRAFNASLTFYNDFTEKLDLHIKCKYHSLIAGRWLSMRLEIIGNIVILSAALLAVLTKEWGVLTAGIAGISISYSLSMTNMLNFLVRSLSDVETNIVSVERIKEYSDNVQEEAEWDRKRADKLTLPRNWPNNGAILMKHYSTRYRPDLDLALIDISAEIRPGEKVF